MRGKKIVVSPKGDVPTPRRLPEGEKGSPPPHRHRKRTSRPKGLRRNTGDTPIRPLEELSEATQAAIAEGRLLVRTVELNLWGIADLAAVLHAEHGLSFREIEAYLGTHSFSRYCVLAKIAREFPPTSREDGFTVSHAEAALQVMTLKGLQLTKPEVVKKIRAEGLKARRVRKHFLQDRQQVVVRHTAKSVAKLIDTDGTAFDGRAVLGDFREKTQGIGDGSVAAIIADPPFSQYDRLDDGHYESGKTGSGLLEGCANDTVIEARRATEALFPLASRVLRPGGTLLVFQPGLKPPQRWLLDVAEEHGLFCHNMLTWPKDLSQPTDFDHAYTYSCERVYVFARPDEIPHDHSDGKVSRSEILNGHASPSQSFYSKIQSGAKTPGQIHKYQKPVSLLEDLVRKHSHEQELVLDVFGCSAATSIACIKHNRESVYFEAFRENYEFGVSRIQKALDGQFDDL